MRELSSINMLAMRHFRACFLEFSYINNTLSRTYFNKNKTNNRAIKLLNPTPYYISCNYQVKALSAHASGCIPKH